MLTTQVKKKYKPFLFKCPEDVLEQLQVNANKYTDGNLSEWLRYAGTNCIPKKEDVVQLKEKSKKSKKK